MRYALCTLDNATYDALHFEQTVDFITNRNYLLCPECRVRATYRRQGRDDRSPCFRAVHADGCTQERIHANTAADTPVTAPLAEIIEAPEPIPDCIVVDFRLDLRTDMPEALTAARQRADATYRRTTVLPLRTLHGDLIVNDDLLRSQKVIVVPDKGDFPAAELFVNFTDVTDAHVGSYHGYWGVLSNASSHGNALYFNSGRRNDMSAQLDVQFIQDFYDRYNITSPVELAGAEMLVFGELSLSRRNKKLVLVTDISHCALRISRN